MGAKRGYLIAVEGIDGAGSTTQARLLGSHLQQIGRKVHLTAEPSQGPIGLLLRSFLKSEFGEDAGSPQMLALLFAADRLHHIHAEIDSHLSQGIDVVTDRYVLSSIVYQGMDLPTSWIETLNHYARKPDLTVLIDVKPDLATVRRTSRGGDTEIFDDPMLQSKIRERYLKLLPKEHGILIDGNDAMENVSRHVCTAVDAWLSPRFDRG
jgi:dTMP kinase